MTEAGIDRGDVVVVRPGNGEASGRLCTVAETASGHDADERVRVSLADGSTSELSDGEIDPDWHAHVASDLASILATLRRAEALVALLTIRDVLRAGDDAILASGLNPWCVNEGLATGGEGIAPHWLLHGIERAETMAASFRAGLVPEDLGWGLEGVEEAARRAIPLMGVITVGRVLDEGRECMRAAGLEGGHGRHDRQDGLGSGIRGPLAEARERASALRVDIVHFGVERSATPGPG